MPASRNALMTSLTAKGSPPRQTTWIFSLRWRSSRGWPRMPAGTRSTPQTLQLAWASLYSASHNGQYFIAMFARRATALVALDAEGHGVAATKAECGDAALQVAALEFIEQRDKDARAAGADRMSDGNRAAVYIHFFRIEFELAGHRDRRHREGLVQFDEVDIFVAVPAGLGQQLLDGIDWRHHYPFRLNTAYFL